MARVNGDGDVRTGASGKRHSATSVNGSGGGKHRSAAVEEATESGAGAVGKQALSNLLMRDDGWLRAIPDRDGKTAFLKWKFSHGKFAGSYVMVVVPPSAWADGFEMLEAKIERVYRGTHKPTKDRDYLPIFDEDMPRQ